LSGDPRENKRRCEVVVVVEIAGLLLRDEAGMRGEMTAEVVNAKR
jgi:hypothetical protein